MIQTWPISTFHPRPNDWVMDGHVTCTGPMSCGLETEGEEDNFLQEGCGPAISSH